MSDSGCSDSCPLQKIKTRKEQTSSRHFVIDLLGTKLSYYNHAIKDGAAVKGNGSMPIIPRRAPSTIWWSLPGITSTRKVYRSQEKCVSHMLQWIIRSRLRRRRHPNASTCSHQTRDRRRNLSIAASRKRSRDPEITGITSCLSPTALTLHHTASTAMCAAIPLVRP